MTETIIVSELLLIIPIVIVAIVLVIMAIVLIYFEIKEKIHSAYHKGYNECRNDEILYYKSMRDLDKSFMNIMRDIEKDGVSFSFKTSQNIIEYTNLLKKYRTKY